MEAVSLNNGVVMPALGLGVFQTPPEETRVAVLAALDAGYRHIDTAAAYGNERQVGEAVHSCGLDRSEVFLETKIWISDYGYDQTLHGFQKSAGKLGVEQIDLLILHQPLPSAFDRTLQAYRARRLAAGWWPMLRQEDRTGAVALHPDGQQVDASSAPLPLLAAASAGGAAGDTAARDRLLDRADQQHQQHPTCYGAAWAARGRVLLTGSALNLLTPAGPGQPAARGRVVAGRLRRAVPAAAAARPATVHCIRPLWPVQSRLVAGTPGATSPSRRARPCVSWRRPE